MSGQDFTLRVSPSWAYLTFDAVDDELNLGDVSALAPENTDSFTASIWFASTTVSKNLFAKTVGGPTSLGWLVRLSASGLVQVIVASDLGGGDYVTWYTGDAYDDGLWHNAQFVFTPSARAIRMDGADVAVTESGTLSGTIVSSADVKIGETMGGSAFGAAFWNRALSEEESKQVYLAWRSSDLSRFSPDLHIPVLAADVYPTISDQSGNGYDGTMTSMAADDIVPVAGVDLREWLDPARPADTLYPGDLGAPSRLNPFPGVPHRMRIATVGELVELVAEVLGVIAPLDTSLSGRLFTAWVVERPPTCPPLSFSSPAGQSSVQMFTPPVEGHYTIGVAREGGGSVLVHIDAEVP